MVQTNRPTVLVVDDELGPRESLKMILNPSFNVFTSEDGRHALQIIKNTNIDLVTLDLKMPVMSGEEVLRGIKEYDPSIEVVIITGYGTLKSAVEAIKYNVFDYILKPFNVADILNTVKRCLERREMGLRIKDILVEVEKGHRSPLKIYKHIAHYLNKLDEFYYPVKSESYLEFVKVLASTLESKDPYTKGHSERVQHYASLIAEGLGLSQTDTKHLQISAYLHDIGKVGIAIKDGPLDEKERTLIQEHTIKGAKIIAPLRLPYEVTAGIKYHHERIDGEGYPEGLEGTQIPLFARIIAIADSYDAMAVGRPYKALLGKDQVLLELQSNAGSQFDPEFVNIFIQELKKK